MDLDQRLAISYYKPIAAINEPHHVYLVQHQETKKIAIKKVLNVYNLAVYAELYRNPIAGTPRIINYYEEAGQLTVIEEYISGTSLQDKISHADIAPSDMLQYMLDLCAILEQLHQHNPAIIHRDVKPSNVIITSYNRAVLLDFNAAKYVRIALYRLDEARMNRMEMQRQRTRSAGMCWIRMGMQCC